MRASNQSACQSGIMRAKNYPLSVVSHMKLLAALTISRIQHSTKWPAERNKRLKPVVKTFNYGFEMATRPA